MALHRMFRFIANKLDFRDDARFVGLIVFVQFFDTPIRNSDFQRQSVRVTGLCYTLSILKPGFDSR